MLDKKNNKHPWHTKIYMEKGIFLVSRKGRLNDFTKSIAAEINLKGLMSGKGKELFLKFLNIYCHSSKV